MIFDIILGFFI